MANPLILDINVTTGESVEREMTDAEFANYQTVQADAKAIQDSIATAQVLADQAQTDAQTTGITHALSLGFTQAQAEAMFP